jgi:hypothetical protein
MVDPVSDLNEGEVDDAPACATCGTPVIGPDHRVVTWIEGTVVRTAHFCNPSCREAWEGR